MEKKQLPKTIAVFPLSNFIIFPRSTVPLNIFEPRYIQMVDEVMKGNRMFGMIQPKKANEQRKPELYKVGCLGKISSFNETEDNRYLIIVNGICRFKIVEEVETKKLFRTCNVQYDEFYEDLNKETQEIKFSDLNLIFKELKQLFDKQGYTINWKELQKQSLDQTINLLSMASPFSLEEKQVLLETKKLDTRKEKLEEILKTYILDNFSNTTLQ